MTLFSEDILATIKDRMSISSIISKHVSLKQKGKDFLGLCPFHKEKTPSFTVNEQKGFYHCFGCGAHGDVFKFLTEYEKLTFPEAVEQCAAQVGITLTPLTPHQEKTFSEREALFKLLAETSSLFHQTLQTTAGKSYYDYLSSRGITDSSMQKFQLGAAQKGRLTQFLTAHNISQELAEKAGLLSRFENRIKEKFTDRLIFPILDEKNRTVGFGGRTLSEEIQPKYLNSAENPIFHKGDLLYGFHLIDHKKTSAVLVEGYLDVIALDQIGFKNVFAPMGTAVTPEQGKKLLKHFTKIYICFDGDAAGFKAMNRAAEIFIPLLQPGIDVYFIHLPQNQDPHSIATSGNIDLLKQKFKTPLNLIQFLILYENQLNPGDQPSNLALRRKNILDRINPIPDTFLKSLYKNEVYTYFQTNRGKSHKNIKNTSSPLPETVAVNKIYEAAIIKAILLCPGLYNEFIDKLYSYSFTPNTAKILNVIETYILSGNDLEFLKIVPYIKQQLPTINFDYILGNTFHVHVPFLNEPITESNVRNGIQLILEQFDETSSLEDHIKEAQERFKQSQSPEDWERLKLLMAQKQRRYNT